MAMANYLISNDLTDSPEAYHLSKRFALAGTAILVFLLEGIARRDPKYWWTGEGVLSMEKLEDRLGTDPRPILDAFAKLKGDGFKWHATGDAICYHWPAFTEHQRPYLNRIKGGDNGRATQKANREIAQSGMPPASHSHASGNASGTYSLTSLLPSSQTPLPPAPESEADGIVGGRAKHQAGAFDPDAPDSRYTGLHLTAALEVMPDLERLVGPLKGRERKSAQEQVALELATLMQAGTPNPQQRIRDALANWPPTIPKSIGIVKQRLHEQVMAKVNPPPMTDEDRYSAIRASWVKINAAAEAENAERDRIIKAEEEAKAAKEAAEAMQ